MKNVVARGWEAKELANSSGELRACLAEPDKAVIRDNLPEAIIFAPSLVRTQLLLCLRHVATFDYPARWPTLLPNINSNLQSQTLERVAGALASLRVLAKCYEYRRDELRAPLYEIVETSFPLVLALLESLAAAPPSVDAAAIALTALKVFSSAIQIALPPFLFAAGHLSPWMSCFVTMLEAPLPADAPSSLDDAMAYPPWKVKKRIVQILHRMLQRYGNPAAKSKHDGHSEQALAFARHFQENYAGRCLGTCLAILQLRPTNQLCPDRVVTLCLNYVEESTKYKQTYAALKPQLPQLLFGVLFPLLCFSERDRALWEEDATEFVRKEFDVMEDFYSPRHAAVNVLLDLTKTRAKDSLHQVVTYCAEVLREAAEDPTNTEKLYRKDGALLAIGSMHARLMKKAQYSASLAPMLALHVQPDLTSQHGFLRLRACWTFGQFFNSLFKGGGSAAALTPTFEQIMRCMSDPELPVRVQAAIAINHFVEANCANETVLAVLPQLVRSLFGLMEDIGNDEVVQALDNLIEKFGERMAPYALEIVQALVQHFLRLFSEQEDDDDDAALAAMGVMQAVATMMQAVHSKPEMYLSMEAPLLPLLQRTMQLDASDFLEDSLEVLSYLTFYSPQLSEQLFDLLPLLHDAVQAWAWEYSNNIIAPVDNLISRGTERFLSRDGYYVQLVVQMARHVLIAHADSMPDYEAYGAVKMLESLLYNCRGAIDAKLGDILGIALRRLHTSRPNSAMRTLLCNVVSGALFYNAQLTLELLMREDPAAVSNTLSTWMGHLSTSTKLRLQDYKVSILGIASLLELPISVAPAVISSNQILLVRGGAKLLTKLEEERRRQAEAAEQEDDDDGADAHEHDDDDDDELGDDDDGVDDKTDSIMRLLSARAGADFTGDFEDEEFDDENPASSALDPVDELVAFTNGVQCALQEAPQLLPLLGLAPPQEGLGAQLLPDETNQLNALLTAGVAKGKAAAAAAGIALPAEAGI